MFTLWKPEMENVRSNRTINRTMQRVFAAVVEEALDKCQFTEDQEWSLIDEIESAITKQNSGKEAGGWKSWFTKKEDQ